MSTSGRIHSEFLRLLYFLADRQAPDYFTALGYEPHKEEYCHRRGVYFLRHWPGVRAGCRDPWCLRPSHSRLLRRCLLSRALVDFIAKQTPSRPNLELASGNCES